MRALLLWCGVAASLLYGAMIWLVRYNGYQAMSQTVSELSAWGVSTRPMWVALGIVWSLLMAAFALGVWMSADGGRSLRIAGAALSAYVLIGLGYPFASMHRREVLAAGGATAADTAHLVIVSVTGVLMVTAMIFASVAFGSLFRLYTAATILALLGFGVLTAHDAAGIQQNLPTPWTGLWERINIMVTLVWIVVLAIMLLRHTLSAAPEGAEGP